MAANAFCRLIKKHIRPGVLAAAVIAAHVAVVIALLTLHHRALTAPIEPPPRALVWIPLTPAAPAPVGESAPSLPAPALAAPVFAPPLPAAIPLAPAAPQTDPAVAALGVYLGCRLDNPARSTEDKERCDKLARDTAKGVMPNLKPTDEEQALARKYARDLEIQNSPIRIPCVAGIMLDPLCVVYHLATGTGFEMETYAQGRATGPTKEKCAYANPTRDPRSQAIPWLGSC